MIRRAIFAFFCLGLFTPGVFAEATDTSPIVLRISRMPNPGDTDPAAIATFKMIDRFLELNPDVRLQRAQGIQIENMVSEVGTMMMIAGEIAPDVISASFRSLDTFVSKGMLAPLDKLVAEEGERGVDIMSSIPKSVKQVIFRPGPDDQTRLYALPTELNVRGLYYNRELFRKAGLPMRAPRDWNELVEFCRKISALGPEYHGIHLNPGRNAAWDLINFLWSAGGEAVEEVGPNEWRAVFDTEEAVTAYAFYYQLVEIERIGYRTMDITPEQRQRVGMFFSYVGDTVSWNPELFEFGAVPKGPTGIRGGEINAPLLGIYSGIKDPRVRDAAWRYVRFMTSPEAARIRIQTLVQLGQGNQVNPVALRRNGFEDLLSLTPPGLEAEFEECLKTGKPEPYGRNCNLIYQEMTRPLDRILYDKAIRQAWILGDMGTVRERIHRELEQDVRRTNERMIGYVAPEVMAFRRKVAAAVIAALFVAFAVGGWYIVGVFAKQSVGSARPVSGRRLLIMACLFPSLGLITLWQYIPLFRGSVMAFQDYQIILPSSFVGIDNFASALFDPSFWNSVFATFHFAAYMLTFGFVVPILLAYALHLIPKHKILYRTVYYLPALMSSTAVFFLWRELFGAEGVMNELLRLFGAEARRSWMEDSSLAMISCVVPGIWAGAGPGCLIYLAALKTIPEEQFEASEIDGGNFLQKTLQIVYPSLRPLIFINLIGAIVATFQGATNILLMTGGGPNGMTEVASLKIFFEAFVRLRFGPATAMAWILGSMLIGVTVLQLKRLSEMEFKGGS